MDCEETGETQAAFVNDFVQIKAACGAKHLLQTLTLVSDTILSYAEGMPEPAEAVLSRPSVPQCLISLKAA